MEGNRQEREKKRDREKEENSYLTTSVRSSWMATVVTCERTWIFGEEEEEAPASHGGGGVELAEGRVLPLVTVTTLPLPLPTLQGEKKHH